MSVPCCSSRCAPCRRRRAISPVPLLRRRASRHAGRRRRRDVLPDAVERDGDARDGGVAGAFDRLQRERRRAGDPADGVGPHASCPTSTCRPACTGGSGSCEKLCSSVLRSASSLSIALMFWASRGGDRVPRQPPCDQLVDDSSRRRRCCRTAPSGAIVTLIASPTMPPSIFAHAPAPCGSASSLGRGFAVVRRHLPIGPLHLHRDRLEGLPQRRRPVGRRPRGDVNLSTCVMRLLDAVHRAAPGPPVTLLSVCTHLGRCSDSPCVHRYRSVTLCAYAGAADAERTAGRGPATNETIARFTLRLL